MTDILRGAFRLRNLTPHALQIHTPGGVVQIPAPAAGTPIPRVTPAPGADDVTLSRDLGIPVHRAAAAGGDVADLPDPDPDPAVLLVVSLVVRAARPHRTDLLSPGPLVRGPDGQPTGCQGLAGNPRVHRF